MTTPLRPSARPYLVSDRHLRHVGKGTAWSLRGQPLIVLAARVFPGSQRRCGVGGHRQLRTPPSPTRTGSPCWRRHRGRSAAAPRSSTPTTGTGCPTAHPSHHHRWRPRRWRRGARPHAGWRLQNRPSFCASCWPGPTPPRSRSTGDRCRLMTRSPAPAPSPDHPAFHQPRLPRDRRIETAGLSWSPPDPRHRRQVSGPPHFWPSNWRVRRLRRRGEDGLPGLPDLALEEELAVREERRIRHALRISRMPHHKTLDDYDFSYQPELDARKSGDLATPGVRGGQVQRRPARPARVGKTHIAVAGGRHRRANVYFTTLAPLMVRRSRPPTPSAALPPSSASISARIAARLDEVGLPARWPATKPTRSSR